MASKKPTVAIVMGSKTDWSTLEHTVNTLKEFGVESTVRVMSAHTAHRTMQPILQRMRLRVDTR